MTFFVYICLLLRVLNNYQKYLNSNYIFIWDEVLGLWTEICNPSSPLPPSATPSGSLNEPSGSNPSGSDPNNNDKDINSTLGNCSFSKQEGKTLLDKLKGNQNKTFGELSGVTWKEFQILRTLFDYSTLRPGENSIKSVKDQYNNSVYVRYFLSGKLEDMKKAKVSSFIVHELDNCIKGKHLVKTSD